MNAGEEISDVLGFDSDECVVVTIAEWTESRGMQTQDGKVKFRLNRESDGDWVLTDFIQPLEEEWSKVQRNAWEMGLPVPYIAWSGPVNRIPDQLLRSDAPLMVRSVESVGWFNLRAMAQEFCECQA